jgi:U3 small nucleolar RNA-associated protein 20
MGVLCHAEEQEADFFYNITHIQSHRKMRALNRLCAVLQRGPKEHADQTDRLTPASVVHFLLPMTLHFVYECVKRDDRSLQEEAVVSLQHLARVLPWSHYYRNLHSIIMQIGTARYEANEKALMRAVSSVIDGFHFNILHHVEPAAREEGLDVDTIADPDAAADDKMNTIVKTVSTRLVPALKNLVISTGMCSVLVMRCVLFPLRNFDVFCTHIVASPNFTHGHACLVCG